MAKYMVHKGLSGLLILEAINQDLKAGQIVKLNDEQANDGQVKLAIKQGYLISIENKQEVSVKAKDLSPITSVIGDEPKTNMSSWDAFSGELVDKEDSKKLVNQQMKSSDTLKIEKADIDFSEEAEISREEIKKNVKKLAKRKTSKKKDLKEKTEKTKKTAKVLRVEDDEDLFIDKKEVEEIGFVDQEQDIDRLKKHPILSKKLDDVVSQNGEVS